MPGGPIGINGLPVVRPAPCADGGGALTALSAKRGVIQQDSVQIRVGEGREWTVTGLITLLAR